MRLMKSLLDRVHIFGCPQALNRLQSTAVGLHRQKQAGANRISIKQNGTSTADPVFTADMGAGETDLMSQKIT